MQIRLPSTFDFKLRILACVGNQRHVALWLANNRVVGQHIRSMTHPEYPKPSYQKGPFQNQVRILIATPKPFVLSRSPYILPKVQASEAGGAPLRLNGPWLEARKDWDDRTDNAGQFHCFSLSSSFVSRKEEFSAILCPMSVCMFLCACKTQFVRFHFDLMYKWLYIAHASLTSWNFSIEVASVKVAG